MWSSSIVYLLVLLFCIGLVSCDESFFDFTVEDIDGNQVALSKYSKARAIIVVNVASNCGYTYTNYRELNSLYDDYKASGLEILAFPSNQFGDQEPGTDGEIKHFCTNFGIQFPLFKKANVNGPDAMEVFKYLKRETGGMEINWNFNKFLVVDGKPVKRFLANVKPKKLFEEVLPYLDNTEL